VWFNNYHSSADRFLLNESIPVLMAHRPTYTMTGSSHNAVVLLARVTLLTCY